MTLSAFLGFYLSLLLIIDAVPRYVNTYSVLNASVDPSSIISSRQLSSFWIGSITSSKTVTFVTSSIQLPQASIVSSVAISSRSKRLYNPITLASSLPRSDSLSSRTSTDTISGINTLSILDTSLKVPTSQSMTPTDNHKIEPTATFSTHVATSYLTTSLLSKYIKSSIKYSFSVDNISPPLSQIYKSITSEDLYSTKFSSTFTTSGASSSDISTNLQLVLTPTTSLTASNDRQPSFSLKTSYISSSLYSSFLNQHSLTHYSNIATFLTQVLDTMDRTLIPSHTDTLTSVNQSPLQHTSLTSRIQQSIVTTSTSSFLTDATGSAISSTGLFENITPTLSYSNTSTISSLLSSDLMPFVLNNTLTTSDVNGISTGPVLLTQSPVSSSALPPSPFLSVPPTPRGLTSNTPLTTLSKVFSTKASTCGTSGCCMKALNQLPSFVDFKESDTAGYVLAIMKGVQDVTFSVQITTPVQLITLLDDTFDIVSSGDLFLIVLVKEIDLEDLYFKTGGKQDVHNFRLQISCNDTNHAKVIIPPRFLNVTVEDVDDCMPVFTHDSGDSGCIVPIYMADTSETYTGELELSPGRIEAKDGDVSAQHNVTYRVMHSEPDNYHEYFFLDEIIGTVNKTRPMNASDPNKYVIFIEAIEDSPQQKGRVAILSIEVFAPTDPIKDLTEAVDPVVKLSLKVISALVLLGFISGFIIIFHKRYQVKHTKVHSTDKAKVYDAQIQMAVYKSSSSSLNSTIPDVPSICSPTQVQVKPGNLLEVPQVHYPGHYPADVLQGQQRRRSIVVKKPLDTKLRPSWNASSPKPRRTTYSPQIKKQ